jgi:hypothetical protein
VLGSGSTAAANWDANAKRLSLSANVKSRRHSNTFIFFRIICLLPWRDSNSLGSITRRGVVLVPATGPALLSSAFGGGSQNRNTPMPMGEPSISASKANVKPAVLTHVGVQIIATSGVARS